MTDLQKQELNVGDNNSAENLAQMGMILGDQLNSGANGNYLVNQLAGLAVESMMLEQLNSEHQLRFPGRRDAGPEVAGSQTTEDHA